MQKRLIFLLIAVVLLLISIKFFPYHCNCTAKNPNFASTSTSTEVLPASTQTSSVHMGQSEVVINSTHIAVDISDTPALREQGLSDRSSLVGNTGMLFIFDTPNMYGFWMKDMNFAIDILWIDNTKHIISCEKSLTPESYPTVYRPKKPILYALELPSGFCDTHKFDTGLNVSFEL
jgi:uncharacterized membrane protein (UPF0127 family)